MAVDSGLASWLQLYMVPGLGGESQRRLLKVFGSPSVVFSQSISDLTQYVKPAIARALLAEFDSSIIDAVFAWLDDPLNHVITIADDTYPKSLLNIPDPPLLLFVKGRLDLLNVPALAIVGSRNASAQGVRNAEAFALSASDSGLCVVSGLAQGIDTAAHTGGLRGHASSIAVVGTGLDKVYPASNRDLAHQLAQSGAIISEFPLGTPPLAANFPRRNRIISGLGLGCLVVEASVRSGSLITARLAVEQGKDVFAIPGSIHSPHAKGCHALIKQGAKLVESANDILEELGHPLCDVSMPSTSTEHPLFVHLGFDPVDTEVLVHRSGLTISELSAILLQLELDGCVTCLPGGLYQRIA
ncbi:MAG: DNA-processing protein DprA [Gammaproteobacteria bacterium]|nr:DNA-processing protein DprA [Gammaproteobacteria bacterium]MBU1624594.1 DNA-processing protein DprA [Gammaproteobacteria bacterium]MBU1982438.1 DNA-processing protein DprA [Gammaproteobacteria bacterium]